MSEKEHPRLILHNFLSPAECKVVPFLLNFVSNHVGLVNFEVKTGT
jgi:hypothetical protein